MKSNKILILLLFGMMVFVTPGSWAYTTPVSGDMLYKLYSLMWHSTSGVAKVLLYCAGAAGIGFGMMRLALGGSPVQSIAVIVASALLFVIRPIMTSLGAVY